VPVVGGFRWAPQQVYGQPDWDLIFRAFFDVGRAIRSERTPLEINETLLGAGVGLELQVKRNLAVRFDYGWRLETMESRPREEAGDGRAHFSVRLLY
jgi:hemolysin activation/secretion protein